jgi:hypothetical protein
MHDQDQKPDQRKGQQGAKADHGNPDPDRERVVRLPRGQAEPDPSCPDECRDDDSGAEHRYKRSPAATAVVLAFGGLGGAASYADPGARAEARDVTVRFLAALEHAQFGRAFGVTATGDRARVHAKLDGAPGTVELVRERHGYRVLALQAD